MPTPPEVLISEVGPRDGLQNEAAPVSTAHKAELVERLAEAGLRERAIAGWTEPPEDSHLAVAAVVPLAALLLLPSLRRGSPGSGEALRWGALRWAVLASGGADEFL